MRGGPLSTRSLHALVVSKLALEKRAACLVNGRQDTSLCGQASPWAHVLHALPGDSCQHRQECGLRWTHASGDNSHSVIQCNVQLFLYGCCGSRPVMHTQRHCRQGLAHPSEASRCLLPSWSQPDNGGDHSWR